MHFTKVELLAPMNERDQACDWLDAFSPLQSSGCSHSVGFIRCSV